VGCSQYALAFDAIYTPMETRLLAEAKAEGCVTVSGLEMFVGQAVKQFEYFTGEAAAAEVVTLMRNVVMDSLKK
jgi:shikimate 5-dehydrogenase